MPKGRVHKTKAKGAQEAHEAIRPTSFQRDPDSIARWLSSEELRLYRLIWQRALASQMTEKRLETTSVDLTAGRYGLRASATRTLFDGFSRVYTEGRDDDTEEDEAPGRACRTWSRARSTSVTDVTPTQHFTEPPPRFTEATLIKALEEHGIGRPSTYAATISTIIDRGYVVVKEKRLHPELVAFIVTDLLVEHFGEFVDVEFTARMEQRLDEIARGEREWVPLMREFYGPFKELVDLKRKELRRADITTEPSDEVCSEGHPMVIRLGRNGRFLSCSLYPEHKESRPIPGEEPETVAMAGEGEACPDCHEGTLVQKRGRFGAFVGCSRYPDCKYIRKDGPPPPEQLPFEVACPTCTEGHLVARRARRTGSVFWGCSRYPKCTFTTSREPVGAVHDDGCRRRRPQRGRHGHLPQVRRRHPAARGHRGWGAARRWPAGPGCHRPVGATWWSSGAGRGKTPASRTSAARKPTAAPPGRDHQAAGETSRRLMAGDDRASSGDDRERGARRGSCSALVRPGHVSAHPAGLRRRPCAHSWRGWTPSLARTGVRHRGVSCVPGLRRCPPTGWAAPRSPRAWRRCARSIAMLDGRAGSRTIRGRPS